MVLVMKKLALKILVIRRHDPSKCIKEAYCGGIMWSR
jgi:hypothetical protein